MKLKEIDMNDIKRNPEQPREHFDTDKLKELGESIKEVGLINPITVEKQGNKFEIVAGERRYRGSKEVKNKKILALVKEYKDKITKMTESLIENWHREDLTSIERENAIYKLWKSGRYKTQEELGTKLGTGKGRVNNLIEAKEARESFAAKHVSTRVFEDTKGLDKPTRKKLIKKIDKGKFGAGRTEEVRKVVKTLKKASEPMKEAILKDEITVDEAEKVSEIKDEHRQKKAINSIKQHKEEAKKYTKHLKEKTEPIKKVEKTKEEIITEALKDLMQQLHTKTFDVGLQCDKMVDLLETLYQATVTHNNITIRIIQNLKPQAKKDIRDCLNVMTKRINNLLKIKEKILGGM